MLCFRDNQTHIAPAAAPQLAANLRGPQVAVIHVASVNVISRNRPRRIDWPYERSLPVRGARAGSVDSDDTTSIASETVSHAARVNVVSVDHSVDVDVSSDRALGGPGARTLHIKRRDRAIGS